VVILLVGLVAWLLTSRGRPEGGRIDANIEAPAAPGNGTTGSSL